MVRRVSTIAAAIAMGVCVLLCSVGAVAASARPYLPPAGHIFAGLTGGSSITAFQDMTGKHPPVFEDYMTWNTPTSWLANPDRGFRSRLALHIGTSDGYGMPGLISPAQIAAGDSDRFLMALGRNLTASGRIVYIRLMAEMNGYWNAYAAFTKAGGFRGSQNAPTQYIAAWRRSVLILRGGPVKRINARLRGLGLPILHAPRRTTALPRPRVAFLWVPQDAGSPDIAANSPNAYFPGNAYVDWIGTDFYASYPNFSLLNAFYNSHPGKPFVLSEWALYGADNPLFVAALFAWVRSHPRVRMLNYYQGFTSSSKANLAHYPASRLALRHALNSGLFSQFAPEFAHLPKQLGHHKRHRRPSKPPKPPVVGLPPNGPISSPPGPKPGICANLGIKLCLPAIS
jgi:hypothetical protein